MKYLAFLLILAKLNAIDQKTPDQGNQQPRKAPSVFEATKDVKPPEERDTLTGNWGGARKKLIDNGVLITSSYDTDLLGNPRGGVSKGFANAGSFGLNLTLDFEKMNYIKGLKFFSSFVYRSGSNLSAKHIGNQFPVAQLYGGETYRLNELYLEETTSHEKLKVKFGRLDGGNDFLASPLYGQYVNNAFCGNPIGIFFNVPFTAYPNSTWGAYLAIKPIKQLLLKFAIYNANRSISSNRYHGTDFTFRGVGSLLMSEWVFLCNQEKTCRGLPGNYKVGAYYFTGKAEKFLGGSEKGNYGVYALFDQMVYRRGGPLSTQGITPFVATLFAPKNRNKFPFFGTIGLIYKGISPQRKDDVLSLGYAYGHYSRDLKEIQEFSKETGSATLFGNMPETFESIWEVNYWIQLRKWIAITPDVQYVVNPKGYGKIQNALVLGAQISIDL